MVSTCTTTAVCFTALNLKFSRDCLVSRYGGTLGEGRAIIQVNHFQIKHFPQSLIQLDIICHDATFLSCVMEG